MFRSFLSSVVSTPISAKWLHFNDMGKQKNDAPIFYYFLLKFLVRFNETIFCYTNYCLSVMVHCLNVSVYSV